MLQYAWIFCLVILASDTSVSIPNGTSVCVLCVLQSNIVLTYTSSMPEQLPLGNICCLAPGRHSSPGLKAWGFLPSGYKTNERKNTEYVEVSFISPNYIEHKSIDCYRFTKSNVNHMVSLNKSSER